MVDSDDEYVQDASDDDVNLHRVTRGDGRGGSRTSGANARGGAGGWEVTRTWENVVEGADGTISSTVEGLLEASKRKRTRKDTTPLQRGIIRHLILVIDLSSAMTEKDLRPTRYLLTLRYAQEFVHEFFEQNPISQLGILGMRDGLAVRVSDISGNPNDHIGSLQALRVQEAKGNPSLQNALDMARAALFHAPSHGTREILLIFGSLLSSDPGDIHTSISALVSSHITCTVIGLAAQVAICRTIVSKTNPGVNPDQAYGVALDEQHYRELIMGMTTPPVIAAPPNASEADGSGAQEDEAIRSSLLMMGFPSRIVEEAESFCACHSRPCRGGYLCTRCSSKVCSLPSICPVCDLTLILSTHLARSYHHLFPLRNWSDVSWKRAYRQRHQTNCFSCQTKFPNIPDGRHSHGGLSGKKKDSEGRSTGVSGTEGASESGRYECGTCGLFFCIDCDVYCHEVVHNCPGCLSREGELAAKAAAAEEHLEAAEGMDIGSG